VRGRREDEERRESREHEEAPHRSHGRERT
jgi:hypothetical protein